MTFDENTNTYTTSKGTRLTREEAEEIYNALDFESYCDDIRNEADVLEIELTDSQVNEIANGIVCGNVLNDNYYDAYFYSLDDAISPYRKDNDAEDEEDEEVKE